MKEVLIILGHIAACAVALASVVTVVLCLYIVVREFINEIFPGEKLSEFNAPPPPKRGKYDLPYSGDDVRPLIGKDPASDKGDITVQSEI